MTDLHLHVREALYHDDLEHLIRTIREHRLSFSLFFSAVTHDLAELEAVGFVFEKISCVHFWVSRFARMSEQQLRQAQLPQENIFGQFLTPEEDKFLGIVTKSIRLHRNPAGWKDSIDTQQFWRVLTKQIDRIRHCGYSVNVSG